MTSVSPEKMVEKHSHTTASSSNSKKPVPAEKSANPTAASIKPAMDAESTKESTKQNSSDNEEEDEKTSDTLDASKSSNMTFEELFNYWADCCQYNSTHSYILLYSESDIFAF
ncbi:hypothetical protein BATDEDRAFT_87839 [Batrachochytrium dendrobatidis JAM81]|uniref:Uncharacterized protein n=1 Tax=Batrachochytrium dendrobatidis (strain JAM81 / FGSC 10211) TaxID=684364 RepID=F4P029_BATDJ|nr:uncharacterized protein BATDEDRAFT_87839 [Batrachochytrium dendrobatidis JAM81]EGF81193.1 hypothetical protein BATDEDRAFT_87839 [Batrachochytrium dendrobatidis JAM81]|eukprot:XP_006678115.1 hypothetical protein BATDEDRAFT_87839 [Batrachochytrium dendrobatidis JAM81]